MANPSLQIGDSNWAIKEDNLLGYSKAGTRFVPEPITMTRESAGTRVNPEGLVETVQLLGSELVDCGGFECATPLTYWTLGGGWSISNGKLIGNNATGYALQGGVFESGVSKIYKITLTVSDYVSGYFTILTSGGTSQSQQFNANGDYTIYFNTNSPSGTTLHFTYFGSFTGSIDNVSVKEVTRNNLARVDYTDGTSSLLAEPERTNLVTYSEDFSNAIWTKSGSSVTPNATTSPDGTINADKLVEDTSTGGHQIQSITSASNSTIYTTSVFVKYAGREWIRFTDAQSSNRIHFNTLTGVFGTISGTVIDYNKTALENGWYKLSFTTTSVATAYTPRIALAEADNDVSYTGDGTSGIYIWGCGFEEGSYATSYIPTDGTTVTRVKDQYEKTGISDLINSTEGVLFVEIAALSDELTYRCLTISDGTNNNRIIIRYSNTSNVLQALCYTPAGLSGYTQYTLTDETSFSKIAFKYKLNDFALWIDGTEVGTSSGVVPTGLNTLDFASASDTQHFYGKVKQLQVYKEALSDSELATLTT